VLHIFAEVFIFYAQHYGKCNKPVKMNRTDDDNSDMHHTFAKQILQAASEGNLQSLQDNRHILSSVSTECRNEHGWTPLMLAIRNGHTETAEFLLQNGYMCVAAKLVCGFRPLLWKWNKTSLVQLSIK